MNPVMNKNARCNERALEGVGEAPGIDASASVGTNGDNQQPLSKEPLLSLKIHTTSPEKISGSNASDPSSRHKAYIAVPLRKPYIFLHRKYLETGDGQLEKVKGDIYRKIKKFNEEQGLTGASLAKPVVRSHPSGIYIGYKRMELLERLHNLLEGQPFFGSEVRFRLAVEPSAPKATRVESQANHKRPASLDFYQPHAKKTQNDRDTAVKVEIVDDDPRPSLKGTPWLVLTPRDRTSYVTLEQVTMAYKKISAASESVLGAKGYHMGIFVYFDISTQGWAESTRLEGTEVLDGFYKIFKYR